MKKEWTLRELAADTGVPERTIRFYISRGLVDPPLRGGRGAAYGAGHKARLEAIKKLQAKGMMLAEIAHAIALANSEPVLREEADTLADIRSEDRLIYAAEVDAQPRDIHGEAEAGIAKRMIGRAIWRDELLHGRIQAPSPATAPTTAPALPEPTVWRSYTIADDVMVMVRAEAGPWRTKRILSALRQFSALVGRESADRETRDTRGKNDTSDTRDEQGKSKKDIKNDKEDKENQGE
jgi:DNA-binding transcriptional MerR regulator